jgi:hypothetical protein
MRDLAAQHGGNISSPAFLQAAAALNPRYAADLSGKVATNEKTNLETANTRAQALSGGYSWLAENPSIDNAKMLLSQWTNGKLINNDQATQIFAKLAEPGANIRGLATLGAQSAIDAGKQATLKETARGHDLSYSSSMYGHNVTRQNNEYNQKYPVMNQVTTAQGLGIMPSRGPNAGQIQGVYEPGVAPPPPAPAAAPTPFGGGGGPLGSGTYGVPNAFVQGAPTNMLRPDAQTPVAGVAPVRAQPVPTAPTLTEVANPNNPMETMRVDARVYKGGGPDAPGVLGIVKTGNLNPAQQLKIKTEMAKDFKAVDKTIAETNALLEAIDAVRNSNLERVAGPIDARTFTMTDEGKMAETRFDSLKGKVTAIAKAASTMTGAIGSIANQEWQILANQIAVLDLKNGKDPSLEQIDQLERQAMSIANRMREGFSRQYGEYVDELGPQYKEIPNVTYTPGSAGYTPKGQKRPAQSSATPASTGNITTNPTIDALLNKYK